MVEVLDHDSFTFRCAGVGYSVGWADCWKVHIDVVFILFCN